MIHPKQTYWYRRSRSIGLRKQINVLFGWYFTKWQFSEHDDRLEGLSKCEFPSGNIGDQFIPRYFSVDTMLFPISANPFADVFGIDSIITSINVLSTNGDEWFKKNIYNIQL